MRDVQIYVKKKNPDDKRAVADSETLWSWTGLIVFCASSNNWWLLHKVIYYFFVRVCELCYAPYIGAIN